MNVEDKNSIKITIEQMIHAYNLLVEEDMTISQESIETAYKAIQHLMCGDSIQARMYAEAAKDEDVKWLFLVTTVYKVHELSGGGEYI